MSTDEKVLLSAIAFMAWDFATEDQQKSVRRLLEKLDDSSEIKQTVSPYFIDWR
jgi:hypothetical protein